jgi:GNAT superfamily N-acetyltransferase
LPIFAAAPALAFDFHIKAVAFSSGRPATFTACIPGRCQLFGASVQPIPAVTRAVAVASCLVLAATLKRTPAGGHGAVFGGAGRSVKTSEVRRVTSTSNDRPDARSVDLRSYAASDFEAVADLWTRVNRELAPAGMETLFEQYIAITIEGELSHLLEIFSQARRNAFWVAELAGGSRRIVATVGIESHDADTTELRRMYVDATWRGGGLAQRLLGTAEATARELGFSRMILSTADIQRAAFRFYTKSGFIRLRSEIAEAMTVKQAGGGLLRHYFEKAL